MDDNSNKENHPQDSEADDGFKKHDLGWFGTLILKKPPRPNEANSD